MKSIPNSDKKNLKFHQDLGWEQLHSKPRFLAKDETALFRIQGISFIFWKRPNVLSPFVPGGDFEIFFGFHSCLNR